MLLLTNLEPVHFHSINHIEHNYTYGFEEYRIEWRPTILEIWSLFNDQIVESCVKNGDFLSL